MRGYKQLVRKNIFYDKRNTFFTLTSITLVVMLLSCTIMIIGYTQDKKFSSVLYKEGNYDIRLLDVTKEKLEKFDKSDNVEKYYKAIPLGLNIMRNSSPDYSAVDIVESEYSINELYAVDSNVFYDIFNFNIVAGRLPQNSNEVIVTKEIVKEYGQNGINLNLNEEVTLPFDKNKTYDTILEQKYYSEVGWYFDIGNTQANSDDDVGIVSKNYLDSFNYMPQKTLKVVGIYDTGKDNVLWHNKFFTVLTDDIYNSVDKFETLTKLSSDGTIEDLTKELDLFYVKRIRGLDSTDKPAHNIGLTRVRYPNYWIEDYGTVTLYNDSLGGTVGAVFLSIIIIINAFTASIAFKTKSLGILMAIGSTKRQTNYLVYKEMLLLTGLSVPIGIILGTGLLNGLSALLSKIFSIDLLKYGMTLNLYEITCITIITFVLALIGLHYCIRRFYRYTPIEAMNNTSGITAISYKDRFGTKIDENKDMHTIINYDEKTRLYIIMKKVFRLEGTIAYKNLSRNRFMNKNCKLAIVLTIALGSIFIYQYYRSVVSENFSVPSKNWNLQVEKVTGAFTEEEIKKYSDTAETQLVYRDMVTAINIPMKSVKISADLKEFVTTNSIEYRSSLEGDKIDDNFKLRARVRGIDKNTLTIYQEQLIAGSLDTPLTEDEIILVSDWTNFKRIPFGDNITDYLQEISNVLEYKVGDTIEIPLNNDELSYTKLKVKAIIRNDALKENEDFNASKDSSVNFCVIVSSDLFKKYFSDSFSNKLLINIPNIDRENLIKKLDELGKEKATEITDIKEVQSAAIQAKYEELSINFITGTVVTLLIIISLLATIMFNIFIRSKELAGLEAVGMTYKQKRKMILCETFALSMQSAMVATCFTFILGLSFNTNDIGTNNISLLQIAGTISIFYIIVVSIITLIGLIPIRIMKKQNLSEQLREE